MILSHLRYLLYRSHLLHCGGYFISGNGFEITIPENVSIGKMCKFDDGVYLRSTGKEKGTDSFIYIGDNVRLHRNVTILTGTHDWSKHKIIDSLRADVTIGNNVTIFTGAIILPGVTIGDNSLIGAGSVVTRDIPANTIAAGNPCRVIRVRE